MPSPDFLWMFNMHIRSPHAIQESSKRGPAPDKRLVEYQFAFSCIWAFGGPLSVDKVADHRANFSKWWVAEWKNVSFPDKVRRKPC